MLGQSDLSRTAALPSDDSHRRYYFTIYAQDSSGVLNEVGTVQAVDEEAALTAGRAASKKKYGTVVYCEAEDSMGVRRLSIIRTYDLVP